MTWVEFHEVPRMFNGKRPKGNAVPEEILKTKALLWTSSVKAPQELQLITNKIVPFRDLGYKYKEKESVYGMSFKLTRKLPEEAARVAGISLVDEYCDTPTVLVKLRVPEKMEPKGDFGVCLKDVFSTLTDNSNYFVQWLEMQKVLGASNVMVFVTEPMHPNMDRVLK